MIDSKSDNSQSLGSPIPFLLRQLEFLLFLLKKIHDCLKFIHKSSRPLQCHY